MKLNNNPYSFIYVLLVGSVFTFVGVVSALTYATPDVPSLTSQSIASVDSLTEYTQELNFFSSDKFLDISKTQVSFAFSFPNEIEVLWLGYNPGQEYDRVETLVSHPQLQNLEWPYLSSEGIQLFQRRNNYTSIEEFIADLPDSSSVRVESQLKDRYPALQGFEIIDLEFDLSEVDYILTTFQPSRFLNDVYYFERVINPELADPDLNELSWYIRASELDAGDTYLLGDIRINYLQY